MSCPLIIIIVVFLTIFFRNGFYPLRVPLYYSLTHIFSGPFFIILLILFLVCLKLLLCPLNYSSK